MITISEALAHIARRASPVAAERVRCIDALTRVLAEEIVSDIDSPPHDKAMVDGYALLAAEAGKGPLRVLEEVTAGRTPTLEVGPGTATRIMTGSPTPRGADCVVMVERTTIQPDDSGRECVLVDDPALGVGANIMTQATSLACGEVVLRPGAIIGPAEIGLLSEVGAEKILVHRKPSVGVLATGDELTPVGETPPPGCIRNSNGPMLSALATRAGGGAADLGVARDNLADLQRLVRQGLQYDILLLSGGVSAGVLDLVPQVLQDLGVEQVFHKVQIKPGKPLWFGVAGKSGEADKADQPTLVFGLPGNPVSSFVCFELFVRFAIDMLSGKPAPGAIRRRGRLAAAHAMHGQRPSFLPAKLTPDTHEIHLLAWQGSADLRGFVGATCLAHFPAGDQTHPAGEELEVVML